MKKLIAAFLSLLFIAPNVYALNPACGQTISGAWVLTSDMDCRLSSTHGVDLESFASLDCNNFLIWGPDGAQPNGPDTGRYGIRIDEKVHVTVTNCRVKNYGRGLNISDSDSVTVTGGNYKQNTQYGVNVANGNSNILLSGFSANFNGNEGIHVGGPMLGSIVIENCFVNNNWEEGIYLHNAALTTVRNCVIEANSANPSASHPGLNIDVSTDVVITNVSVDNQARIIGAPQESMSICLSSLTNGCN